MIFCRSGYLFIYQFWLFFLPVIGYLWYSKQDSDNNPNTKQPRKSFTSSSPPPSTTNYRKSTEI